MSQTITPLVGDVVDRTGPSRRGANAKTKMVVAAVVGVLVLLAAFMTWNGGSGGGNGQIFTIQEGTYKSITTPGIDTAITLPTVFLFKKGDDASITIVNNDIVDHRAGPFLVGAGQTYTQRFPEPGQYAINCSVNAAESITVTVEG